MRIDPDTLSPARRYYLMISCIIPRPIAWVGTVNENGSHNLAPFSYFNGFSSTPPIVGIGFGPHDEKTEKDTLRNVRRTGELTINLGTIDLVDELYATAEDLPYGEDEFASVGLTPVPGETVAAPRVAEAPISLECTTWDIIDLGGLGSTLLLAEIKLFHLLDTLIDYRGTVDPHRYKALARLGGGRFAELTGIIKLPRDEDPSKDYSRKK
ncbi:flavin reductase family protein [bacterium]|nr:flavin reductase family protein [bacterium]